MTGSIQGYVNQEELLQVWQAIVGSARIRGQILDLVANQYTLIQTLTERVATLERQAGITTDAVAQTQEGLDRVENGLRAVEDELQRTQDVIDLEDIEKRLAAQGIAAEDER